MSPIMPTGDNILGHVTAEAHRTQLPYLGQSDHLSLFMYVFMPLIKHVKPSVKSLARGCFLHCNTSCKSCHIHCSSFSPQPLGQQHVHKDAVN